MASQLDHVPGVAPGRRAALLKAFGSVAALQGASAAEIARASGIPLPVAERVRAHLGSPARVEGGTP